MTAAQTRTAVILVIDGFGIGAMPDASALRESDGSADTLGSVARWARDVRRQPLAIGHLMAAGLGLLRPDCLTLTTGVREFPHGAVVARRAALGYPGADTFAGHQTMMGTDMSHVTLCRVGDRLDQLRLALTNSGHQVELFHGTEPLIVVDGEILVHDNLEADPALNWNVSASLADVAWEQILAVADLVREVAPVARVIAVGGFSDRPLGESVRPGPGGTIGLDTPASGFYRLGGLRVQHLGAEIDTSRQLPEIAAAAGLPVTLVGKAADILHAHSPYVTTQPGVDTKAVLADTRAGIERGGLTVANVQQTDLAGHQQDPARFAALLEEVDNALPHLVAALPAAGVLVVTADHGNDPLIGHAFHTREFVPVLEVHAPDHTGVAPPPALAPDFDSLASVGALVAGFLGLPEPG